jgi:REP-associated tyrosine transposase
MTFNPDIHHRRSIRLRDYDYSQGGAYFVTICAWQRECLFGEIVAGEMQLNETGRIICAAWNDLPNHYKYVELDEFVAMPNHVHGIIVLSDVNHVGAGFKPAQLTNAETRAGLKPAPTSKRHGLSEIIRGFKTFSSRRVNELRQNPGCPVWQRNYYERVFRNGNELARAREYIVNNPLKWELDKENPINCP